MPSTQAPGLRLPDNLEPKPSEPELDETGWAAAILATVQSEFRAQGFDVGAPPGQTDVPLTPRSEGLDAGMEDAEPGAVKDPARTASSDRAKEAESISVSLNGGSLGRVKLTVGREQGGVKVEIGIEDLHQRALAGLEQGRLVAALRAAGLKVASVTVASPEATGTGLAEGRRRINGPTPEQTISAYRGSRPRQSADSEDGVDLVG